MDSTEYPFLSSTPSSGCSSIPDCGFWKSESGVVLSCLECFLGEGSLYCFEYGASPSVFLTKFRGGTCTTAKSDSPEEVIHRAMYLLQNGFGNYDIFERNCEDFALYCKTGLVIHDQGGLGRSGQACAVISAPLAAMLSSPLKLFTSSPVGMVLATAGMYCFSRYATDIGVRADVVKVKVEDMALFHGCEGQRELVTNNERCKRELNRDQTDMPTLKRQRYMCCLEVRSSCSTILSIDLSRCAHVHLIAVTYYFFHWKKGTPFSDDQGIYNRLTWWEQVFGAYCVMTHEVIVLFHAMLQKALGACQVVVTVTWDQLMLALEIFPFFCCGLDFEIICGVYVYLVRYLIASHTTGYQHPMLFFNTLAVFVLVVAKFPNMHKVRIFGINADQ
nr:uncharacterized protein LOC109157163 [Ipomoea batatas]